MRSNAAKLQQDQQRRSGQGGQGGQGGHDGQAPGVGYAAAVLLFVGAIVALVIVLRGAGGATGGGTGGATGGSGGATGGSGGATGSETPAQPQTIGDRIKDFVTNSPWFVYLWAVLTGVTSSNLLDVEPTGDLASLVNILSLVGAAGSHIVKIIGVLINLTGFVLFVLNFVDGPVYGPMLALLASFLVSLVWRFYDALRTRRRVEREEKVFEEGDKAGEGAEKQRAWTKLVSEFSDGPNPLDNARKAKRHVIDVLTAYKNKLIFMERVEILSPWKDPRLKDELNRTEEVIKRVSDMSNVSGWNLYTVRELFHDPDETVSAELERIRNHTLAVHNVYKERSAFSNILWR